MEEIERISSQRLAELDAGHPTGTKKDTSSRNYVFANESEEEFARILDYYKIDYLYEPTTFPLRWDSEGNIEMFLPLIFIFRF